MCASNGPAKYALLSYLRFWQMEDFHLVQRVAKDGLPAAAADIRSAYSFGINLASNLMPKLADAVMQMSWGGGIVDRAKACIDVAQSFAEEYGADRPFSGVTKLAWFVKPEGWVPFDRYAVDGLGVPNGKTKGRLLRFYCKLSDTLPDLSKRIQRTLKPLPPGIRPERIVDRYLWLRGMDEDRRHKEFAQLDSFLEAQIPAARTIIKQVRKPIAQILREADLDRKKA